MITIATKFAPKASSFALAVEAGYTRAELWSDATVLTRWREVVEQAIQHPLEYALHFPNSTSLTEDNLREAVALYEALNCHALIVHQNHFNRYGKRLQELSPGIRLAVENHRLHREGFARWAESNPGLTLDVEHLWKFTVEDRPLAELIDYVRRFLEQYGHKLHHVHLPGYLPGQQEHRPMYCSRDMVMEMFNLLQEQGFSRLIVSEVDQEYQTLQDLQRDLHLYESWKGSRS